MYKRIYFLRRDIDKFPYSIIGTNVSVLCGLVKEICDSEFNKEDFLATMFGGIIAIVISLFSLL